MIGAVLAGGIGAAAWATVVCITGYEIRYVAVGVGALVGLASRKCGGGRDYHLGMFATACALLAILVGQWFAANAYIKKFAGEVAAAMTAAGSAADAVTQAVASDGDDIFLEVAAAKIRSAEAAQEGAAIAHQVHGAIGFTKEHTLHRFTRRLWAWRDDFGNESAWAVKLGQLVAVKGADRLWPMLAAR